MALDDTASGGAAHRGSAAQVFAAFLKLGVTSFGGPIAHLGYFRHEFFARRKWLDEASYADIVAGTHPKDRTIRPQVVTKQANPDYHAVIGHFERLTGRGAVLIGLPASRPIVLLGKHAIASPP